MREKNKHNKLIKYLSDTGILETGTKDEINQAKKVYWSKYKKDWNKRKRGECKSFEILLNPAESNRIKKKAKEHHTSPTNYIKICALAKEHVVDPVTMGEIRELLVLYGSKLEDLVNEQLLPAQVGDELGTEFLLIEKRVLEFISISNK